MATGSFETGSGAAVVFNFEFRPFPGEAGQPDVLKPAVAWASIEDKLAVCEMYQHPVDPIGMDNLTIELARLYGVEQNRNPLAERLSFAERLDWAEDAVLDSIKAGCLWSQQFDPDTQLTTRLAFLSEGGSSESQVTSSNGAFLGTLATQANGVHTETSFAPNGNRFVTTTDTANVAAWMKEIETYTANTNEPVNKVTGRRPAGAPRLGKLDRHQPLRVRARPAGREGLPHLSRRSGDDQRHDGGGAGERVHGGVDRHQPRAPPQGCFKIATGCCKFEAGTS